MEIQTASSSTAMRRAFLVINAVILAVGVSGGPLIMRLYFVHGGKRIWFSSWLQTGGWPITLAPLAVSYVRRRRCASAVVRPVLMDLRVFSAAAVIGLLTGLDDYLYSYGVAKLPVSTSSLIISTQLAFTAVFAFLLVRQRFTSYTVNSVVLLTLGAVVLGLNTNGDRPAGETNRQYWTGFLMTAAAAVLYGFVLPLIELTYRKARQALTFTLALEIQMVMCFFATTLCTVGMVLNNDFQAIGKEAKAYDLGETKYYVVVVFNAIMGQCFFLGAVGVIFFSSSLLSGVVMAVFLPITEVLAVFFYNEKFQAEKGISLFLSLWGFVSYLYGDMKNNNKNINYNTNKNDNGIDRRNSTIDRKDQIREETQLALQLG